MSTLLRELVGAKCQNPERNVVILEARLRGETLRTIGDEVGISYGRVQQICAKANRIARHRKRRDRVRASEHSAIFDWFGGYTW